jgi:peptidoglycan/xylan/chitin deacetylase (PgdA/CDA1 family)
MACCLCFDFDALSLWLGLFRFTTANPLSRGEFGATVGVPRILDLLDRYELKATFFVPGHTAVVFPDAVRAIHARGHEVAAHSMYHAPYEVGLAMSGIEPATPEQQRGYLEQQIEALEKLTGERPVGFRSPIGDWVGEHVPQYLIELGFTYDSSLQGHDFVPYRLRIGDTYQTEEPYEVHFGEPSSLLEIPLHWDTNDFAHSSSSGITSIRRTPGSRRHRSTHPRRCSRTSRAASTTAISTFRAGCGTPSCTPRRAGAT